MYFSYQRSTSIVQADFCIALDPLRVWANWVMSFVIAMVAFSDNGVPLMVSLATSVMRF